MNRFAHVLFAVMLFAGTLWCAQRSAAQTPADGAAPPGAQAHDAYTWDIVVIKPFTSKSSKKYALGKHIQYIRTMFAGYVASRFVQDPRIRTMVAVGTEEEDSALEALLFNKAGGYSEPDKFINYDQMQAYAESVGAHLVLVTDIKEMSERVSVTQPSKLTFDKGKSESFVSVELTVLLYDAATRETIFFKFFEHESKIGEKKWTGYMDDFLHDYGLTVNTTGGLTAKEQNLYDDAQRFFNSPVGLPFKSTTGQMLISVGPLVYERLGIATLPGSGKSATKLILAASSANDDVRVVSYVPETKSFDMLVLAAHVFDTVQGFDRDGVYISAGDFDGNGVDELVLSTGYDYMDQQNTRGSGMFTNSLIKVYAYGSNGFNVETPFAELSNILHSGKSGSYVAAGDFDGDGDDELVVSQCVWYSGIKILDYKDGHFLTDTPFAEIVKAFPGEDGNGAGADVAVGDFNGDGIDELAVGRVTGNDQVKVYDLSSGAPVEIADIVDLFGGVYNFGVDLAAGDFDGDGRDELVVSSNFGDDDVRILSYSNGAFDTKNLFGLVFDNYRNYSNGLYASAGDFDGDGRDELVLSSMSDNDDVRIYRYENGAFNTTELFSQVLDLYSDYDYGVYVATGSF